MVQRNDNYIATAFNKVDEVVGQIRGNNMLTEYQKSDYINALYHIQDACRDLMRNMSELYDYKLYFDDYIKKAHELFTLSENREFTHVDIPDDASELTKRVIEANNRLFVLKDEMLKYIRQHKSQTLRQPMKHVWENVGRIVLELKKRNDTQGKERQNMMMKLFGEDVSKRYTGLQSTYSLKRDEGIPF